MPNKSGYYAIYSKSFGKGRRVLPATVGRARGRIGQRSMAPNSDSGIVCPVPPATVGGRPKRKHGRSGWPARAPVRGSVKRFMGPQGRRSRNSEPAREDSNWRGLSLCLGRSVVAQPLHAPGERPRTGCPERATRIEGYATLRPGLAASLRAGRLKAKDLLEAA